jgi:glycosyltransferase involved in cell wall biosynthesis
MVYIYALCNVYYDSFYLKGIKEVFSTYEFNIDKFPKFRQGVFAVLITDYDLNLKLIIDSNDSDEYNEDALKWCDTYGKVNYRDYSIPKEYSSKIKPIGPSFGIKIWSFPLTLFLVLYNFLKFREFITDEREFIANYWRQYRRVPLKHYKNASSLDNYIFFTGSIWQKENQTNNSRAEFIKLCKENNNLDFEGGFAPRDDGNNLNLDNLVVLKRYSLKEYIRKIKKSAITFSTPAVLSCHGWKLGEFLALGKAIISTKHINRLPAELEDGVHVIYVETIDDIREKLNLILFNPKIKNELEKNARIYFDAYLTPKVVIENLINRR